MTVEELEKSRIAWRESDKKRDEGLTEPSCVASARDLAYDAEGDTAHLLDVYWRKDTNDDDPLLVNIHGGGWFYGDKELYRFYSMHLAEMGFVVGTPVTVVTAMMGNLILQVKDCRVALNREMANRIMI